MPLPVTWNWLPWKPSSVMSLVKMSGSVPRGLLYVSSFHKFWSRKELHCAGSCTLEALFTSSTYRIVTGFASRASYSRNVSSIPPLPSPSLLSLLPPFLHPFSFSPHKRNALIHCQKQWNLSILDTFGPKSFIRDIS